jgi:hypothetical protein
MNSEARRWKEHAISLYAFTDENQAKRDEWIALGKKIDRLKERQAALIASMQHFSDWLEEQEAAKVAKQ